LANTYDKGDLVRVSAAFTSAGAAIDPTAVTAKYKTPAGTTTTLVYGTDGALVRDSAGNYHVDVDADEVGTWYYRFASTGTGQAASEEAFRVRATAF
jgi:hypothetical protein